MRLKLDENLGARWADFLGSLGHDVRTVPQEGLSGASDVVLFETCVRERRCLISLDLDFADVLRFPPKRTAGIAVLRIQHGNPTELLRVLMALLLGGLQTDSIAGRLWIVESTRIRIHEPD
jgi:predicted nuclease of predicted toxin-antitoxin system